VFDYLTFKNKRATSLERPLHNRVQSDLTEKPTEAETLPPIETDYQHYRFEEW